MFDQSVTNGNAPDDLPLLGTRRFAYASQFDLYGDVAKRLFDILCTVLTLPFLVPVLAVVMILVARDGHSPLYSQRRVGRGGREFTIWKIRTMSPDAEQALETLLTHDADAAQEWAELQKLKDDPRITRIGRILRKMSIDELPQLWNVLTGDMSLVGPRPMMSDQRKLYPGKAYYALRPGLTGLWQISDRNETTFAARATFDTDYYRKMSFRTDCKILAATVGVVMSGTGY